MAESREENRAEALKRAVQQIEKSYGKGAIMCLKDAPGAVTDGISTGALSLDLALGGAGIPRGRTVEIFGPEGSGKTTLCLHIVAEAQKIGGAAAFIDVEHAFDPSWAKRLGVKWIQGGECGHMWRIKNQYMDTMNGPADFLEEPVSPITGTKFENAKSTKMVHIAEFTADLIKHNKLKLDPSRNDNLKVTFHDSCNTVRGMGIMDEPRYVIKNVCNHFYEMPENTIREQTFCCGSGSGLNAGENMELRMRG